MTTTDNRFLHILFRAKYYLGLIIAIIIILIWHFFKIDSLEKSTETERLGIINRYEIKLDSLNEANLQQTAKTFSRAIRGELLRGNKEQINQYFNEFIKTPGIIKLQLINTENSVIEISTDKKYEGTKNVDYVNIKGQEIVTGLQELRIVTPISNMNNFIGIFILEANKMKK